MARFIVVGFIVVVFFVVGFIVVVFFVVGFIVVLWLVVFEVKVWVGEVVPSVNVALNVVGRTSSLVDAIFVEGKSVALGFIVESDLGVVDDWFRNGELLCGVPVIGFEVLTEGLTVEVLLLVSRRTI